MSKTSPTTRQKILISALNLATQKAWSTITFQEIARHTKISKAQVTQTFTSMDDVIIGIMDNFSQQVLRISSSPEDASSLKDRLFEIYMSRIDLLQKYRPSILNILTYIKTKPSFAPVLLRAQIRAMEPMLNCLANSEKTVSQPLVIMGLLGVYGATLWRWQHDATPDMSKTMATLDRSLRYYLKVSDILLRT